MKLLLFVVFFSTISFSQDQDEKVKVIVVNGVNWNQEYYEDYILKEIKDYYHKDKFNGAAVEFEFVYNSSINFWADLLEGAADIIERDYNIPRDVSIPKMYNLLNSLGGIDEQRIADEFQKQFQLIVTDPDADKYIEFGDLLVERLKEEVSNSINNGYKVILVGESQGSLILNRLSDEIINGDTIIDYEENKSNIAQVYFANPAKPKMPINEYVLNDEDIIRFVAEDDMEPNFDLSFDILSDKRCNSIFDIRRCNPDVFLNHFAHTTYLNFTNNTNGNFEDLRNKVLSSLGNVYEKMSARVIDEITPLSYNQLGDNNGVVSLLIEYDPKYIGNTIQIDYGENSPSKEYVLDGSGSLFITTNVYSYTQINEVFADGETYISYNLSAPTVVKFSDFTDVQYYGYYESDSPYIKPHIEASYNIYYGGLEGSSTYTNIINTIGQRESAMLTLRAFCKIIPNGKEDEDGNSETLYELRDAIENTVIAELDSCDNYSADGFAEMVFLNQKNERIGNFEIVFEDKTAIVPND